MTWKFESHPVTRTFWTTYGSVQKRFEFRAALHQMVDRLTNQLRRNHEWSRDHQASKLSEAYAEE